MALDLTSAMLMGARAAPNLDPSVTLAAAQNAPDGSNTVDQVETVAGLHKTMADVATYQNQTEPQVQQALQHHHESFISSMFHFALGLTTGNISSPKKFLNEGLSLAGSPLRATQHAFRSAEQLQATHGGQAGFGGGAVAPAGVWGAMFSPHQWAKAWSETTQGEKSFDPHVISKVQEQMDPATFKFVADVASRASFSPSGALHLKNPEDSLALVDPNDRADMAKRMQSDPSINGAIRDLAAAKLSFGRAVVGHLARSHPGIASPLSGALDGAFDWFGDPTSKVLGAVSDARKAALLAHTPEDVNRIFAEQPSVRKFAADVADHLSRAADADTAKARNEILGRLAERHPKLMPALDSLVDSRVRTAEDFQNWLGGQTGMKNLFTGRLPGFLGASGEGTLLPHMGALDMGRIQAKTWAKAGIDFMADHPTDTTGITGRLWRIGARGGRVARRLTTLTPESVDVDPTSPEFLTHVQRYAALALPAEQVRQFTGAMAAAETLGEKRKVFLSMHQMLFDAVGLNDSPSTKAWAQRFIQDLDEGMKARVYSPVEHGVLQDGENVNPGLLEQDMTEHWSLPSAKRLFANAKRLTMMEKMGGTLNADTIDRFMTEAWKPGQLARFGFPLRSGGEEAVSMMLREHPMAWLRGRLAATAAEQGGKAFTARSSNPIALGARYLANITHEAMAKVAGKLTPRDYLESAQEMLNDPVTRDSFLSEVSALHHPTGVFSGDDENIIRLTKDGARVRRLKFEKTGDYHLVDTNDEFYHAHWKDGLDKLSRSQWGRTALETRAEPVEERVRQVADALEGSAQWAKSVRARVTTDGRSVVGGEATARQAAEDHARVIIAHADAMTAPKGRIVIDGQDLADRVLSNKPGETVTTRELKDLPAELKPDHVVGEKLLALPSNWMSDVLQRGMTNIVGRPMDWLVRQPIFVHEYTMARRAFDKDMGSVVADLGEKQAAGIRHELSLNRAIERITPFIHDPEVKSQFAVQTRNLFPFWFAQEQFYKRWAAEFYHSPEAIREAQLAMMGLRHTGVLHTDDKGNDYWMYPFVSVANHAVNAAYSAMTGKDTNFAINPNFMGQVQFASPGLERIGLPSFGPLAAIPIQAVTNRFKLAGAQTALLGRGAGKAYWEQVMPTTVTNLVHTLFQMPDSGPQMTSAMMQAAQYLEATGHGWDTSKETQKQYQNRLYEWSRNLLFLRMIYGYSGVAAPQASFDINDLNPELRRLNKQLGIQDGVKEFMRRHPEASAYTVFQSNVESGPDSLPATKKALDFLETHKGFAGRYAYAGAWFTPQDPGDFDMSAYREQMMLGLRHKKTFAKFVDDLGAAEAGGPYWKFKDERDARLKAAKAAGDTEAENNIRAAWSAWSQPYLSAHPDLEAAVMDPTARIRRQQTMVQMGTALADPDAPQNPQTDHLRAVVRAYQEMLSRNAQWGARRDGDATAAKRSNLEALTIWLKDYSASHKDVDAFITHVVRPIVDPQGGAP